MAHVIHCDSERGDRHKLTRGEGISKFCYSCERVDYHCLAHSSYNCKRCAGVLVNDVPPEHKHKNSAVPCIQCDYLVHRHRMTDHYREAHGISPPPPDSVPVAVSDQSASESASESASDSASESPSETEEDADEVSAQSRAETADESAGETHEDSEEESSAEEQ